MTPQVLTKDPATGFPIDTETGLRADLAHGHKSWMDWLRKPRTQPPFERKGHPAPYDRAEVWRKIGEATGELATRAELATLSALQAQYCRWNQQIGSPEADCRQAWASWTAAIEGGESVDGSTIPSASEYNDRARYRAQVVRGNLSSICEQARPLAVTIIARLPGLAQKLIPEAEAQEASFRSEAAKRDIDYVPSIWLRQLWQTEGEAKEHLERVKNVDVNSPG